MAVISAGLLVYRRSGPLTEFLLGHPGGPLWARKDFGAWMVAPSGALRGIPLEGVGRDRGARGGEGLPPRSAQLGLAKCPLSNALQTQTLGEDMANGWAHEGAVLDQIEDTITDGVLTARARLPVGEGAEHCVEGGDDIPAARR